MNIGSAGSGETFRIIKGVGRMKQGKLQRK